MLKLLSKEKISQSLIAVLFFLSGFSSLIYQVLWMRKFKLVLGSSVFSVSIVVASFMIGLLIGSLFIGKAISSNKIKNELRYYGFIELFIGLYALFFLVAIHYSGAVYGAIYRIGDSYFYLKLFLNSLVTLVFLVIPTSAMGATLPLLVNYFSKKINEFKSVVSSFYAINTLGGAAAALIAGFYLIKLFGVNTSICLAAAINIAIGVTAILISRKKIATVTETEKIAKKETVKKPDPNISAKQILFISLITGFIAIAYEVLWIRCLNYLLNNSTYTFSLILFVFLASIAIGSYIYKYLRSFKNNFKVLAVLQFVLSIAALFTVYVFYHFVYSDFFAKTFINGASQSMGWYDNVGLNLYLALIVFFIPSLIMGVSFPLISDLYFQSSSSKPGTAISSVYTYNMIGSVLGSLLPVFVLIPLLGGVKQTMMGIVFLNFIVAVYIMIKWGAAKKIGFALVMLCVFCLSWMAFKSGPRLNSLEGADEEQIKDNVLFYKEGTMATVKVYDKLERFRSLSIDGVTIASEQYKAKEKLIAHLPFFTDKEIKTVLAVGLASGNTVGSMLYHKSVEKITAVEIVPDVVEAARLFDGYNNHAMQDQRVEVICDDITSYLTHTKSQFDLISSDGKFGALNKANTTMLSADFYELCSRKLNPGGLFIQWISTEIPSKHFDIIIETTKSIFKNSELFLFRKNLFIISSNSAIRFDTRKIESAFTDSVLVKELDFCNIYSAGEVISSHCLGWANTGATVNVNSFDKPLLEYDYQEAKEKDMQISGSCSLNNLISIYGKLLQNDSVVFSKAFTDNKKRDYSSNMKFLESRIAYIKGNIAHEKGDYNNEMKYLTVVSSINHPDNWNDVTVSCKMLAEESMRNKWYQKAIEFSTKFITLAPEYSDAYTLRGIAKINLDRKEEAMLDFKKALSLNPNDQVAAGYLK